MIFGMHTPAEALALYTRGLDEGASKAFESSAEFVRRFLQGEKADLIAAQLDKMAAEYAAKVKR